MSESGRERIRELRREFHRRLDQRFLRSSLQRLMALDGVTADPQAVARIGEALEGAGEQLVHDYPATGAALLACASALTEEAT